MQRRIILSLIAVVGVVLVLGVAAVAVYALAGNSPVQAETVDAAPVQAEPASAPVKVYERASYQGGCSRKATTLMTQQSPAEPVQEELLTQAVD